MLRLLRFCLPVLAVVSAAPAVLAQVSYLYTPTQYTYPSLLGTDGNLYGTDSNGVFKLNLSTNAYSVINSDLTAPVLCSVAPDGTFLGINANTIVKVTMQGIATTLATLPAGSVCPVLANDGNYYGGYNNSGDYGDGYLYQLTPAGKMTVLYNFTGGVDGTGPGWPMLQGSDGNLYGVGGYPGDPTGRMFRYSAANGLTAYSSTAGIVGPLYEGSDGNFNAMGYDAANLYALTPQGGTSFLAMDVNNDPYATPSSSNFFLGGSGSLYLEEYYSYVGGDSCPGGDYFTVYSLSGLEPSPVYTFGTNEAGGYGSDFYSVSEFLAGNGNFYGGFWDSNTSYNNNDSACETQTNYYGIYSAPSSDSAPVQMSASANRILPGKSTTVSWTATSAFSDSLQQCYRYNNGLSSRVATSGSQALTFPNAGTYISSVICGGTQTGIEQIVVGGTQLSLNASPTTVIVGQSTTLFATVENPGTPSPTGKVQFLYGTQVLATSKVGSTGIAEYTASTAGLAPGSYTITAKYLGDGNYSAATSSPLTITVQPMAKTTTTLTTSTSTLLSGQTAMFTANVSNASATAYPTGTVTLYLGAQTLLSGKLTAGNPSTVSLSASTEGVAPGSYPVTAKYSGDASNTASTSASVTVTVQTSASVTVSATPNPVPAGDSFNLSAKVTESSGTPTGTVIFSAGSTELAGASLNNSGVATVTVPAGTLAAGTYSITAAYDGNPSGTSPAYSLTVQ